MYGIRGVDAECPLFVRSCLAHSFQAEKNERRNRFPEGKVVSYRQSEMSPGPKFILFCLLLLVLLLPLLLRFVLVVIDFWLLHLFEIGRLLSMTVLTHWANDDLELPVLLLHFPSARIQM